MDFYEKFGSRWKKKTMNATFYQRKGRMKQV